MGRFKTKDFSETSSEVKTNKNRGTLKDIKFLLQRNYFSDADFYWH